MVDQLPSAPQRGSGLAFVQHWDWVAQKGLMPRNTAMGIRAAVSQILKVERDWESLDVSQLDVEGLIARFRNLSSLSPGSLATYESRFRSGLESYLDYLNSPATYQPKGRKRVASRDLGSPVARRQTKARSQGAGGQSADGVEAPDHPTSVRLVVYPFPVRPGVFAELKLPADLTLEEAARLSGFLKAVALSDGSRES